MSDPTGFMKHSRAEIERRPVEIRIQDWKDVYEVPSEALVPKLQLQASRCMDCGVPFCQVSPGCPLENLIPDWNDLVQQGRWKEALSELHSTNNFPEFTGKLCPAPCESACVLGITNEPVTIRSIESSIIDRGFQEGWVQPQINNIHSGKSVAIIGSGPAGLAAAQQLRRFGHEVTIFERSDQMGGLLRYGIPDFKMEKSLLDRRLKQMFKEGVQFKTGIEVGTDITIENLKSQFQAICLTTGAEEPRSLKVPGQELKGVHYAMDFLIQQNRINAGQIVPNATLISAAGKRVVILGGGDTGSDCLGTVHRQGAKEVTQLELFPQPPLARSESSPWPSWPYKLRTSHAHEEGGKRVWGVSTLRFTGNQGRVERLHAVRVEYKGGLFHPIPHSELELEVDLVLLALGFTGAKKSPLLQSLGLEINATGNIPVDSHYSTKEKGVFAAGDAKRGASLIVWAIAEGRKMASSVHNYLQNLH
jgi:glutamate synthase (NADPH/NADH) small chain